MPKTKPWGSKWKKLHYPVTEYSARNAITILLKGRIWKRGESCRLFRHRLAEAVGVPPEYVLLTNSCTSAIATAVHWFGDQDGWTAPVLTFAATYSYPLLRGWPAPLWDTDDQGWARSAEGERPAIDVDLWGRPAPFGPNLPRVLDAAHRFAGEEHPLLVESGVAVCYSFGPMKEVAGWEGGALVWRELADPAFRAEVEAWLDYGQRDRHPTGKGGMNGYMNEATARLLTHQLRSHAKRRAHRQEILGAYKDMLGDLLVTTPSESSGHLAVVLLSDRGWTNRVRYRLRSTEIEYGIYYRVPDPESHPSAYDVSRRMIALPCHTRIAPSQAQRIAKIVLTG